MTLCIGALARNPSPVFPCIVLGFDYMASNDMWGSESAYKFHVLSNQLVAMFAGSPGRSKELALIYKNYLRTAVLAPHDVVFKLREPLLAFKNRMAETFIGRTLAKSYTEFLTDGETWLGKDAFEKRLAAIEKHDLRVRMIIAGFVEGEAVLLELRDGELDWSANFVAIGTGHHRAEPALHEREHLFTTVKNQAIYNVYEAKKLGESSPHVGRRTRMYILLPPVDGTEKIRCEVLTESGERELEKLFAKYGPKPMPIWPDLPPDSFQLGAL